MQTTIGDYNGVCLGNVIGRLDMASSFTLQKAVAICDALPTGSNLTVELRKNSDSSGNVLAATLRVTTTESLTNGRYYGTPVTSFSNSSMSAGDVFYAYVTDPGSTIKASNVRIVLVYS